MLIVSNCRFENCKIIYRDVQFYYCIFINCRIIEDTTQECNMYIETLDMDEGDFMDNLEDASIEDLKAIARCASRWINKVLYNMPLYGIEKTPSVGTMETELFVETEETYPNKWTIDMEVNVPNSCGGSTTIGYLPAGSIVSNNLFDNLPCPQPAPDYNLMKREFGRVKITGKEQQMNCYQTPAYNEVQQAKQHLVRRVDEAYYTYGDKLHETFNMGQVRPKNVKQAKDWLARGGMVVSNPEHDDCSFVNVQWQDPDKPRNAEGFKAAQLLLGKDYQNAKDAILVKAAEDGLKALQEFEAKVYN